MDPIKLSNGLISITTAGCRSCASSSSCVREPGNFCQMKVLLASTTLGEAHPSVIHQPTRTSFLTQIFKQMFFFARFLDRLYEKIKLKTIIERQLFKKACLTTRLVRYQTQTKSQHVVSRSVNQESVNCLMESDVDSSLVQIGLFHLLMPVLLFA